MATALEKVIKFIPRVEAPLDAGVRAGYPLTSSVNVPVGVLKLPSVNDNVGTARLSLAKGINPTA
ncbi:MAG: hypothetical protein ACK5WY_08025, partial [Holosporaceae bacterium]